MGRLKKKLTHYTYYIFIGNVFAIAVFHFKRLLVEDEILAAAYEHPASVMHGMKLPNRATKE